MQVAQHVDPPTQIFCLVDLILTMSNQEQIEKQIRLIRTFRDKNSFVTHAHERTMNILSLKFPYRGMRRRERERERGPSTAKCAKD